MAFAVSWIGCSQDDVADDGLLVMPNKKLYYSYQSTNFVCRKSYVFAMNASHKLSSAMVKHGAFTFDQAQVTDDPSAFPHETPTVVLDLTIPYE